MAIYTTNYAASFPVRRVFVSGASEEIDSVWNDGLRMHRKWLTPPETIEQITMLGTNFNLYLRNLTRTTPLGTTLSINLYERNSDGDIIDILTAFGVGYATGEYTLELKTTDGKLAAPNVDQEAAWKIMDIDDIRDGLTITGVPDGFEFACMSDSFSMDKNFRVQRTASQVVDTEILSRHMTFRPATAIDTDGRGVAYLYLRSGDFAAYHYGRQIMDQDLNPTESVYLMYESSGIR